MRLSVVAVVLLTLVAGLVAVLAPTFASAAPAPSVSDVQRQLGTLALEKAQMVEKYDQIQNDVEAKQQAADAAVSVASTAQRTYQVFRQQLVDTVVAQYESGGFGSASSLLGSADQQSYIEQTQTLSLIRGHNDEVVATATTTLREAQAAQSTATELLATAKARRDTLLAQKAGVDKQIAKYKDLLATLTTQQQVVVQRALNPQVSISTVTEQQTKYAKTPKGTPAAAAQAVKFALNQVGKPYAYGAAGPDSYDCSGLTMASYASAGISLPHSAAQQYDYGNHVQFADLMPGDLLFYYSPIGHVTIYIGDGMMVSAPQTGQNVSVVPVSAMAGFVGATRLVG